MNWYLFMSLGCLAGSFAFTWQHRPWSALALFVISALCSRLITDEPEAK